MPSGESAKWPMMVMRATERGEVVLNARAAPAEATVARRSKKDDIVKLLSVIDAKTENIEERSSYGRVKKNCSKRFSYVALVVVFPFALLPRTARDKIRDPRPSSLSSDWMAGYFSGPWL